VNFGFIVLDADFSVIPCHSSILVDYQPSKLTLTNITLIDIHSPTIMSSTTFTCTVCCEDRVTASTTKVLVAGINEVCEECITGSIVPMFTAALEHEHNWPVKWGSTVLNVDDFPTFLDHDFRNQYKRAEEEYATPGKDRVYCPHAPCGAFVRDRSRAQAQGYTAERCSQCQGVVCLTCNTPIFPQGWDFEAEHKCHSPTEEDPFKDLIRGKAYQLCPKGGCGLAVQLAEACNHMICAHCSTGFCYVCGEETDHDGPHWQQGGCPRWNHPEAENAMFDPPPPTPELRAPADDNWMALDDQTMRRADAYLEQVMEEAIRDAGPVRYLLGLLIVNIDYMFTLLPRLARIDERRAVRDTFIVMQHIRHRFDLKATELDNEIRMIVNTGRMEVFDLPGIKEPLAFYITHGRAWRMQLEVAFQGIARHYLHHMAAERRRRV
jgi:hypothetical protein